MIASYKLNAWTHFLRPPKRIQKAQIIRLPVTTAECSSPQARWITASSRIQNLLSKKRLLPNVNTAPESETKREGITQHGTHFVTCSHHDQSYLQHLRTILKELNKSKINKPGTSSSSDAILVSTKGTYCWPMTNQCVSCVTRAKTFFVKRRRISVNFRDISVSASASSKYGFRPCASRVLPT